MSLLRSIVVFAVGSKLLLDLVIFPVVRSSSSDSIIVTEALKTDEGTATSGKLFSGNEVYSYDSTELMFSGTSSVTRPQGPKIKFDKHNISCDRWSVVTTIFEPSEAVRNQALMQGWCLVVVGDKKGPETCKITPFLAIRFFLKKLIMMCYNAAYICCIQIKYVRCTRTLYF